MESRLDTNYTYMDKNENISKLIIIDKDSIAEIVQDAVNIAFEKYFAQSSELGKSNPPITDDLTDVKGIAEYTHYSVSTVYTYVQQKKIPFYRQRNSRKLLFSKKEVLDWIKTNRSGTMEEKSAEARSIKIKTNHK